MRIYDPSLQAESTEGLDPQLRAAAAMWATCGYS